MNTLKLTLLSIVSLFIWSCSSNDDNNNTPPEPIVGDYYPSKAGSNWIYTVTNSGSTIENGNYTGKTDLLESETSGSNFTFSVTNDNPLNIGYGFMSRILDNATFTRTDSKLNATGFISVFPGLGDFNANYADITLYDLNASNNDVISEITESITRDDIFDGIPITANYTITVTSLGNGENLTVGNNTYQSYTRSAITIKAQVFATLTVNGSSLSSYFIGGENSSEEVVTIDNYFAENTGLVKSETSINYAFEIDNLIKTFLESRGYDLDSLPTSANENNLQELTTFIIPNN